MSRRRKWIVVGILVGSVGVGIAIYFAWGAKLEAEYEGRVQVLRDRRDYVDEARSWYAEIPAAENAAVALAEAAELLDRVQKEDEGVLSQFTLRGWDSEWHGAEAYERLRRDWPKLNRYFAKLEEAGRRPVFAPPEWTLDLNAAPFCGIQDVTQLLQVRARVQPEMAPECVRLLLNLADRWRPDDAVAMRIRFTVRCMALGVLQVGLRDGTLDAAPHREAWDRQLAGSDPIAALRDIVKQSRVEGIRFVEKLREGLDPWVGARKAFEEDIGDDPNLRNLLEHLELPWYARWYGRPVLHREAVRRLDEARFAIAHATSARALREVLREEHAKRGELGGYFGDYALALEHLAELRLARIAMAIQVDAKAHGGPGESLDAYAAVAGGGALKDPFTGEAFLYERHDDRVVLRCCVGVPGEGEGESLRSRLFEAWRFEELLTWEVRWAPAKQAD